MTNNREQLLTSQQLFISCIIPAHNEQELIQKFLQTLTNKLSQLTQHYEIIIINDGSTDETEQQIKLLMPSTPLKLISFSRNFGKEKAITAGLEHASGDVAIIIDADFQHPIEVIPEFLKHWAEGYDMVYGVRKNRDDETWLKRFFANNFYRLMHLLTNIKVPANAGDFRLLDRKVIDVLNSCTERSRFMKGLYNWAGFNSLGITFQAADRPAGKSSWRLRSLTSLAITGITAFSTIPLRAWGLIGLLVSFISFVSVMYIVLDTLIFGADVPGYATLIVTIIFFGGIQLLSIGILGEYLGRVFEEVKKRPQYVINEKIGFKNKPVKHDQETN